MREIRRRTRVVGAFPDGKSALMLAAARLRHVAATGWGHEALSTNEPTGRSRGHRITLCSGGHHDQSKATTKTTTFLTKKKAKCERLWTLPRAEPSLASVGRANLTRQDGMAPVRDAGTQVGPDSNV